MGVGKMKNFLKRLSQLLFIPTIFSFLGSIGGSQYADKGIRRFGLPGLTLILAIVKYYNLFPDCLWLITVMFGSFVLALGYGVPSQNDLGSKLGRFWYKIFKGNKTLTNIFTRGTVGVLYCLTLISIPLLNHQWLIYILGSICIISAYAFISWRNLGSVKIGKYTLCYSDVILYGVIGLVTSTLIYKSF
jgi:hypothetical protein